MKKEQKGPNYPWDTICIVLAVSISFPLCMAVLRVDSVFLILAITLVLALVFEVIAHAVFKEKIAKKKAEIDMKFEAKEKRKKEKALALNPAEQVFYDKFTGVLKTLSEKQFNRIAGYYVQVANIVGAPKVLYAESKALGDYATANRFPDTGNEENFKALAEYYEDLMQACGTYTYLKKNMTVKGPEFGVISTNAADTMLYGAIVESDIKKQVRRNDYSQKALFEQQTEAARAKLFRKIRS